MIKYFKGKFLISKVIASILILSLAILRDYEVLSNTLHTVLMITVLILFFIVDSRLRNNE